MYYVDLNYNNQDIKFEVNKNDFIEYLWQQKFGKPFRYTAYILDDPNSKIYNQIENDWLNNNINQYDILKNNNFIQFIKDKYSESLNKLTKDIDEDDE